MRHTYMIAAAIGALMWPACAEANGPSGNDLVEACRIIANGATPTADNALKAGICIGQVEALSWLAPGVPGDAIRSCVPADVSPEQMAKVVVAYIDKYHNGGDPFEGLALQALARVWPCEGRGEASPD